jgi:hypothetical protein
MSNRDDAILAAIAALGADLQSPDVVASIDTAIDRFRALRDLAASLHGAAAGSALNQTSAEASSQTSLRPRKTFGALIESYLTDERSGYRNVRHNTRESYNRKLKRLMDDCSANTPSDFNRSNIADFYAKWTNDGKTPGMGHALVTAMRVVVNYGATVLEDDDWARVSVVLRHMRFKMKERSTVERLTREQAIAIITKAHEMGFPALALAQAFQTDCGLRQTDVIGEWVPQGEPGVSAVTDGSKKWIRGIRWSQINSDNILEHTTSWSNRHRVIDLNNAPLVKAELKKMGERPKGGAVIVNPRTRLPYVAATFRLIWRQVADAAGVPRNVKNTTSGIGAAPDDVDRQEMAVEG